MDKDTAVIMMQSVTTIPCRRLARFEYPYICTNKASKWSLLFQGSRVIFYTIEFKNTLVTAGFLVYLIGYSYVTVHQPEFMHDCSI